MVLLPTLLLRSMSFEDLIVAISLSSFFPSKDLHGFSVKEEIIFCSCTIKISETYFDFDLNGMIKFIHAVQLHYVNLADSFVQRN